MRAGPAVPERASRAAVLREGYEDLRRVAIGRDSGVARGGRGLALFLSRGMVAWMAALLSPGRAAAVPSMETHPAPGGVREELTGLLASLLLARQGG